MKRVAKIAGAGPLTDYAIGDRVMTREGYPGTISDILEGPADLTTIWVDLDGGMGGGEYAEAEIQPLSEPTTAGRIDASVEHTAADDYPELGTILSDRLPPQINSRTASKTSSVICSCGASAEPTDDGRFRCANGHLFDPPTDADPEGHSVCARCGSDDIDWDHEQCRQCGSSQFHTASKTAGGAVTEPLSPAEAACDHPSSSLITTSRGMPFGGPTGIEAYRCDKCRAIHFYDPSSDEWTGWVGAGANISWLIGGESAHRYFDLIPKTAGAAWTHTDDDDYDDDLSTGYVPPRGLCADCYSAKHGYEPEMGDTETTFAPGTCSQCGKDGIVFTLDPALGSKQATPDEAAAHLALYLPPKPLSEQRASGTDLTSKQKAGYQEGFAHGQEGITRNPSDPDDPDYMAGYDIGWAEGVTVLREPANSWDIDDLGADQTADVPANPLPADHAPTAFASLHEAGEVRDWMHEHAQPGRVYSYDWCRFRRDSHCWLPKGLNEEASKVAGYAVWIPEDRGTCFRVKWEAQQKCPTGAPGPHVSGGFTDATIPWEEGGQRNGEPGMEMADPSKYHAARSKSDVEWVLPGKKRPFAYSTTAQSDLISLLAGDGKTWSEISSAIIYDPEAKAIADQFVTAGYGDTKASEHVRSWTASLKHVAAFEFTATWKDIQSKAKRIRTEGGVRIVADTDNVLVAHVKGDSGIYETEIVRYPGKKNAASWSCGCKWASYSWGRSGPWKKFEGRMCSHALALQYEAQSRGAHGRSLTLDEKQPAWMDQKHVHRPGDYDKNKQRYSGLNGDLPAGLTFKHTRDDPYGMASELFRRAKQITPDLYHSDTQTPDGEAWSATIASHSYLRPVEEQDDSVPSTALAMQALTEGQPYQQVRQMLLSMGEKSPAKVVASLRTKAFKARIDGEFHDIDIDRDGFYDETGEPVDPAVLTYPQWHPTMGLDPAEEKVLTTGSKDESVPPSEHGDPRMQDKGVSVSKTKDGKYYVHTHRARGKYRDSVADIPDSEIEYIRSTGAAVPPFVGDDWGLSATSGVKAWDVEDAHWGQGYEDGLTGAEPELDTEAYKQGYEQAQMDLLTMDPEVLRAQVKVATENGPQNLEAAAKAMLEMARRNEPDTTLMLSALALEHGGDMVGLDNRLKTEESLLRKIKERLDEHNGNASKTAYSISDSLRYTMMFPTSRYTESTRAVLNDLRDAGYNERVKNYWEDGDTYDGINVAMMTPKGHPFELQFHTPESLETKDISHRLYEDWRVNPDPTVRKELAEEMIGLWDKVPNPSGALSIPQLKRMPLASLDDWGLSVEAMPTDLPEGLRWARGPVRVPGVSPKNQYQIQVKTQNGQQVGHIRWATEDTAVAKAGEIIYIFVRPEYRRRGIATEMLRRARVLEPRVHHSTTLTDDGSAWAQVVASLSAEANVSQDYLDAITLMQERYRTRGKTPDQIIRASGKAWPHVSPTLPSDIQRGKLGDCYRNALNNAIMSGGKYIYVEGYANSGFLPLRHAWVVDGEGTVYDPTWPQGQGSDYFGVAFDTRWVTRFVNAAGYYGVFAADIPGEGLIDIIVKGDLPAGAINMTGAKDEHEAPTVSGVALKAADTGRVLFLQRGLEDEKDPARGTWEFPGGHHEDGDLTSLHAAIREWEEEVGVKFPEDGHVAGTWTSPDGVYCGHIVVIPEEKNLILSDGRDVDNPDDPDGDASEQVAWWDLDHAKKNPALREECKQTPWAMLKSAAVVDDAIALLEEGFANGEVDESSVTWYAPTPDGQSWAEGDLASLNHVAERALGVEYMADKCGACLGTGEQPSGHECYICDGSGQRTAEIEGRAAGVTNTNPENGLPVGTDHDFHGLAGPGQFYPIPSMMVSHTVSTTAPKEGSKMDISDEFGSLFDTAAEGIQRSATEQRQVLAEWGLDASLSELHDEPEPALPTTDGAEEEDEADKVASLLRQALPVQGKAMNLNPGPVQPYNAPVTASQHLAGLPVCPKCQHTVGEGDSLEIVAGTGLQHKGQCPSQQQTTSARLPGETEAQRGRRLLAYADAIARGETPPGPNPFEHVLATQSGENAEIAAAAQQYVAKKQALKSYSPIERQAIIDEGEGEATATNLDRLDIKGTHYEALESVSSRAVPEDEDLTFLDGDPNLPDV